MARRRSGDKPGAIRRATVAEVVARGSAAASVNAIATRAGLAVGTLYRYHATKADLLRAVHLEIKTELHDRVMAAAQEATDSPARIRAMWFTLMAFARDEPEAFLYTETIMGAALLTPSELARLDGMRREGTALIEAAVADGTLRPTDPRAIVTVLSAPALQLGRSLARGGTALDPARVDATFELCWRAVAARDINE
ncbi:TetR/AcrR family transcriptional regulator [Jannaschia marina]|uniref:TetR/AcrR family transcriptional regulator n=1 Tax=Jannaschia marina TaxID=2741674 RepID=UPI0015C6E05B|nr:TetR/AcrR family transcriptional regulator [Jannaschia marina]